MSLALKQFAGSTVTPKDDSRLYDLFIGTSGIVTGVNVSHLGTNQILVSTGWGIIMGHVFGVIEETVNVTLSGGTQGRLLIQIDLANTEGPITFVSQAADVLPPLTQEDINSTGTVYQYPLTTYDVGATAVGNLIDIRTFVTGGQVADHDASKITTGVLSAERGGTGGLLPVAYGGTGASTSSAALSNLGGLPKAGGTVTGLIQYGNTSVQNIYAKFITNSSGDYFGLHAAGDYFYLHKQAADGSILGTFLTVRPDGSMKFGGKVPLSVTTSNINSGWINAYQYNGFVYVEGNFKLSSRLSAYSEVKVATINGVSTEWMFGGSRTALMGYRPTVEVRGDSGVYIADTSGDGIDAANNIWITVMTPIDA